MAKGGKRNGAGRKAGIPNKSTLEIKEIFAQEVDFRVVARKMFELAKGVAVKETGPDGQTEIYTKEPNVPAAKLLLEYGHGKPKEVIELDAGANTAEIVKMFATVVSSSGSGSATP